MSKPTNTPMIDITTSSSTRVNAPCRIALGGLNVLTPFMDSPVLFDSPVGLPDEHHLIVIGGILFGPLLTLTLIGEVFGLVYVAGITLGPGPPRSLSNLYQ